jgi:hypothetical protein
MRKRGLINARLRASVTSVTTEGRSQLLPECLDERVAHWLAFVAGVAQVDESGYAERIDVRSRHDRSRLLDLIPQPNPSLARERRAVPAGAGSSRGRGHRESKPGSDLPAPPLRYGPARVAARDRFIQQPHGADAAGWPPSLAPRRLPRRVPGSRCPSGTTLIGSDDPGGFISGSGGNTPTAGSGGSGAAMGGAGGSGTISGGTGRGGGGTAGNAGASAAVGGSSGATSAGGAPTTGGAEAIAEGAGPKSAAGTNAEGCSCRLASPHERSAAFWPLAAMCAFSVGRRRLGRLPRR